MKIIRSNFFKYVIVLFVFGIWIFFFDDYKLSKQRELQLRLKALQEELKETENQINEYQLRNKMLKTDMEIMEAVGRSNYYMKRDNEDLYIFLTEDENGKLIAFEK